eukprot:CAMPEP_0202807848 /NCGR_PEP_ID=MMETSP1389-20130828/499_1 /ASSEMBLY_ACC=CAM_ASM_000865 /TAXON_ID=302021 /ORGANISM="Rhodomonas sp., Strain CCMP768" /LENGTH=196 /DNA_ID=CAMNT_0049477973 /DNA_START=44 /DNA_END=634 /DNA_ORIENTATION=-
MTDIDKKATETEALHQKRPAAEISKDDPFGLLNHGVAGMRTVTAELWFDGDCENAIELYKKAFNAKVKDEIYKADDGKVMHSMVEIGDVTFMLADCGWKAPDWEWTDGLERAPKDGVTTSFWMYSKDVDGLYKHCLECGMTSRAEPKDMFWGDRMAKVKDQYGFCWDLAKPLKNKDEETTPEEKKQKLEEVKDQAA